MRKGPVSNCLLLVFMEQTHKLANGDEREERVRMDQDGRVGAAAA